MINRRFKANRPKVIGSTDINPYWEVIKGIIRESDILLEVCDARMPELSRNEEIEKLAKSSKKQLVIILNKSDLVNFNQLMIHIKTLSKEFPVFALSGKSREGITRLRNYLFAKAKKVEKLRIGVLGYPNTGKSSVINAISRRGTAKVSSRAGTTRGQQWINAGDNMLIIDSPGVIPLRKEDEPVGDVVASFSIGGAVPSSGLMVDLSFVTGGSKTVVLEKSSGKDILISAEKFSFRYR